jgi:hypothetical protein
VDRLEKALRLPPPRQQETETGMSLVLFEQDRDFIVQSLRHGRMDHLEPVTGALEADLFRHLLGRQIPQRLAESFLSPRQK